MAVHFIGVQFTAVNPSTGTNAVSTAYISIMWIDLFSFGVFPVLFKTLLVQCWTPAPRITNIVPLNNSRHLYMWAGIAQSV